MGALGSFPSPSLFRFLVPNLSPYSWNLPKLWFALSEVTALVGSNLPSCALYSELINFPLALV